MKTYGEKMTDVLFPILCAIIAVVTTAAVCSGLFFVIAQIWRGIL